MTSERLFLIHTIFDSRRSAIAGSRCRADSSDHDDGFIHFSPRRSFPVSTFGAGEAHPVLAAASGLGGFALGEAVGDLLAAQFALAALLSRRAFAVSFFHVVSYRFAQPMGPVDGAPKIAADAGRSRTVCCNRRP